MHLPTTLTSPAQPSECCIRTAQCITITATTLRICESFEHRYITPGLPGIFASALILQLRSPDVKLEHGLTSKAASTRHLSGSPDITGAYTTIREGREEDQLGTAWRSYVAANNAKIHQYMEAYMNYVYPIFPLFHGPTLWERMRRRHHLTDRGFFASIMAACSLSAARARDGAIPGFSDFHHEETSDTNSEIFFAAAQAGIFKDLSKAAGFGVLRACGLLALTSIQYGQIHTMHQYVGYYHTLCSMQKFHSEDTWSTDLSWPAREERRRLFWTMYQLDIYISCVFHGMPRVLETSANVNYPMEIVDEELGTTEVPSPSSPTTWLRGFNFTVDLYRILAHTLQRVSSTEQRRDRAPVYRMFMNDGFSSAQIMEHVMSFYYQQPAEFRKFDIPVTGDRGTDIFGFQVANIQATLQLVRITLMESDSRCDGQQKCNIVHDVLTTFREINTHYLKAISTPLVYHLGRIGHILASVYQGPLTDELYNRARQLLTSLADLLEDLESGLQPTAGASKELREQIDRIDKHMQAQERGAARLAQMQQQQPQTMGVGSGANMPHGVPPNIPGVQMPFRPPQSMPGVAHQGQMDEFQLPQELTGEWPWPFEFQVDQNYHMLPGFTNEEE